MPQRQPPRRRRPRAALLLTVAALALLVGSVASPVRAAAYDRFYANFAGEELMRAMNADRAARGLPRLRTDPTLEAIARDRALACPSNKSLTIRGRARDMAERGYLSHAIQGCSDANGGSFDTFDFLHAFGYTYAAAAEDLHSNNYPTTATTYKTGCNIDGTGCHGSIRLPWTVAVAERSFMNSRLHRANILSTGYGRFGCAAWASSTGYHYYACYFVKDGSARLDGLGPVFSNVSGIGATFKVGATPTFTATATDALSLLSDGYATIDGVRIRNWAWDHAGRSAALSAIAPRLAAGTHTFRWWVRDASTRSRAYSFQFHVGS